MRRCVRRMGEQEIGRQETSEQARKIEHEAIPQGAEGLYYNKGLFSEVLAYYDDEALYFECRGKDSGIVRFSFEMLQTLGEVIEEHPCPGSVETEGSSKSALMADRSWSA